MTARSSAASGGAFSGGPTVWIVPRKTVHPLTRQSPSVWPAVYRSAPRSTPSAHMLMTPTLRMAATTNRLSFTLVRLVGRGCSAHPSGPQGLRIQDHAELPHEGQTQDLHARGIAGLRKSRGGERGRGRGDGGSVIRPDPGRVCGPGNGDRPVAAA